MEFLERLLTLSTGGMIGRTQPKETKNTVTSKAEIINEKTVRDRALSDLKAP